MGRKFKIKLQTPDEPSIKQKSDSLVFDFAELRSFSYVEAKRDGEFFIKFLERLKKLGNLSLKTIYTSGRHSFGMEKMEANNLTASAKQHLPAGVDSLIVLGLLATTMLFLALEMKMFSV